MLNKEKSRLSRFPRGYSSGRTMSLIPMLLVTGISNLFSFQLSQVPLIKFDELTHDFGVVKQGVSLEHTFKFTNEGDGQLIITSVQPSCGCTGVITDGKKEFSNGEEGEIKITFSTEGRQGVNTKTVIVNTNDLANPVITLSFKCEIEIN
jgi:hypothetical protein